jgi:hypothetical protein
LLFIHYKASKHKFLQVAAVRCIEKKSKPLWKLQSKPPLFYVGI